MMDEFVLCWLALMNGLFQSIQNKPRTGCAARAPTDNPPGKYVDDESDIDKALTRRDIGEVADPQYVRRRCMELTIHPVQWTG